MKLGPAKMAKTENQVSVCWPWLTRVPGGPLRHPKIVPAEKMIDFKGVSLEIGAPSIISGQDADNGVSIDYDSHDASMLHVDHIEGPKHLRRQLGNVAAYAMLHKKVLETPYIMGVTYAEMARVGVALGMRRLDITSIDGYYEADVRATHAISFAGSQRLREFESAAVYLPTAEFVDRYYV